MKHTITLFICTLMCMSCYKTITIENFSSTDWKKDVNGCEGLRAKQIDTLFAHREELIENEYKQQEIERFLGKPNRTDLDARMRKVFYYYYSPSPECDSSVTDIKTLAIEFESLNRVRFISKAEL